MTAESGRVSLADFDNSWYSPGRAWPTRALWLVVSRLFFSTRIPWPYPIKRLLLRMFGCSVGSAVVLKPSIVIKYPWNITIGKRSWIGEGVWIDSLAPVSVGPNVCISQGAMIETGNHDWSDPAFGLQVDGVDIEDGVWIGARALVLPGSRLESHAVLTAGSVLSGSISPYSIWRGNPAAEVSVRTIRSG